MSASPFAPDSDGKAEIFRAGYVRRIHRRDPEFHSRRLRLLSPPPADRHTITWKTESGAQPPDERELFERGMCGNQESHRFPSRRRDEVGNLGECFPPILRFLRARLAAHQRPSQTIVTLDPAVIEAADVAHPVAVHLRIEARRHANELCTLGPFRLGFDPCRRVAAFLAQRADRVDGLGVIPRPRLEPVILCRDGAHRTHIHQVSREQRVHALLLEGRDLAPISAIDDVDLRIGVDFPHEPHASRAENAAVAIEHQRRTEVHVGFHPFAVEHAPGKFHPAFVGTEAVPEVLQRTLAALVTDRAVERVIDQEEFEDARPRLDDIRRLRGHHHALRHRRRARRLQFRHLLDLDDADAAGSVDAKAGVVAVVRDLDAALDGGLKNSSALFDGDGAAVDGQRDGVHIPGMISKACIDTGGRRF